MAVKRNAPILANDRRDDFKKADELCQRGQESSS
jgi:hypothetical protein